MIDFLIVAGLISAAFIAAAIIVCALGRMTYGPGGALRQFYMIFWPSRVKWPTSEWLAEQRKKRMQSEWT